MYTDQENQHNTAIAHMIKSVYNRRTLRVQTFIRVITQGYGTYMSLKGYDLCSYVLIYEITRHAASAVMPQHAL